jgi:hypothetical protein
MTKFFAMKLNLALYDFRLKDQAKKSRSFRFVPQRQDDKIFCDAG